MMNNNVVRNSYNWFVLLSDQWFSHFGNICVNQMDAVNSKNDLIVISQEIKNTYPSISAELFRLKDNLFDAQLIVNPIVLGELIALLRFLSNTSDNCDFWDMVHPSVVKISKKGYMQMFAGAISALRNPKAHANIVLEKEECKRNLIFASMLMYKLDEGVKYTGIQE